MIEPPGRFPMAVPTDAFLPLESVDERRLRFAPRNAAKLGSLLALAMVVLLLWAEVGRSRGAPEDGASMHTLQRLPSDVAYGTMPMWLGSPERSYYGTGPWP